MIFHDDFIQGLCVLWGLNPQLGIYIEYIYKMYYIYIGCIIYIYIYIYIYCYIIGDLRGLDSFGSFNKDNDLMGNEPW